MSLGHHKLEPSWSNDPVLRGSTEDQRERTRRTLESFMMGLKTQDREALLNAKSSPVWCKHCGHELSLGGAKVNKEEECFQLLCPCCRELIIQVRTRHPSALRMLARLFSLPEEEAHETEMIGQQINDCLWAFQKHDYSRCVDLAVPLALNGGPFYLMQIVIISAQRLGHGSLEEQMKQLAIGSSTKHSPWETTLLKLTLGMTGGAEAMRVARSETDRCRLLFYQAARHITLGEKKEARSLLKECLKFNTTCIEQTLVDAELEIT